MSKQNDKAPEAAPAAPINKEVLEAITMGVALGMQQVQPQQAAAKPGTARRFGPPCPECKQPKMGCGKKHKQVVVYPRNPRHARFFQGVRLNGVRYISNGPGHAITVPADAPIEHLIQTFEKNEDEQTNGRVVDHNSGVLGRKSAVNRATKAWR